jgi:4'-phosphopantetheinyl transferase
VAELRRTEDRARHATGALLADALVGLHGGPRARVRRERGRAPRVEGADLHVSVAHAGAWVAAAIARHPVGVDVEPSDRAMDVEALAEQALAPAEREALAGRRGAGERDRALLTWWTRKEAVLKATGDGLTVEPREVIVSAPWEAPRLLAFASRPALVNGCVLADLAPDDRHLAAVAVLTRAPVTLTQVDGASLLRLERR